MKQYRKFTTLFTQQTTIEYLTEYFDSSINK